MLVLQPFSCKRAAPQCSMDPAAQAAHLMYVTRYQAAWDKPPCAPSPRPIMSSRSARMGQSVMGKEDSMASATAT